MKIIFHTFKLRETSPLPSRGRAREGVECAKILPALSFTPHPNPLPARERELKSTPPHFCKAMPV